MSWKTWGRGFNELLARYEEYLWPDLIILGGGMAKEFPKYQQYLKSSAPLVVAAMGRTAGIVGAARVGGNAVRASRAIRTPVQPSNRG
jgi:polyphosphate glucokinase